MNCPVFEMLTPIINICQVTTFRQIEVNIKTFFMSK